MPKSGLLPVLRGVSDGIAAGVLVCFDPGDNVSAVFGDFLAASLVGFEETQVLGGEVYGPRLSAAAALHQVLTVRAEYCLHVSRAEADVTNPLWIAN
jgi:hypothetical protein